jgi:hypothetical protein
MTECMFFKTWLEEIKNGDCLFYGQRTKCCFQNSNKGEEFCKWDGKPPEIKVNR